MTGRPIAVLGGGAWGTALAAAARRAGRDVRLWARDRRVAKSVGVGENPVRLPGVILPDGVAGTTDLATALDGAESVLLAVPAQAMRAVTHAAASYFPANTPAVICAKGIERGSHLRMAEVLTETVPQVRTCVLSGPTFAAEVAQGLPAAITVASEDREAAETVQSAIGSSSFRPYLSDDPIGVEIGGAVKNVIALAAGIATGRRLGENARAALVSRGLAEMIRLAVAAGGKRDTLMGLSGIGDLVLTAMSPTSRNTSFGIAVGRGRTPREALIERDSVTEGFWTAEAVVALADRYEVEMPITRAVDAIVKQDVQVEDAIAKLLERPVASEFEG